MEERPQFGQIEAAYVSAQRAFRSPTLALLHKRDAPLVCSLLGMVFTATRPRVAVSDAHTEIGDALAQLRAAGYEPLPDRPARELCRQWVEAGWLITHVEDLTAGAGEDPEETEFYRLSAHAVGALEIAGRAGGARTRVSRSRVRTLLDAVDHLAEVADPDIASRQARLQREIEERKAQIGAREQELRRLDAGGEVPAADTEQLLEEAENVLALLRELPADFARVAESIKAIQRETVTALRRDERPTGEVLAEYLERAEHLMSATAEGRAFAGALGLIGDTERLDLLAQAIDGTLRHPFASQLPARERGALRGITATIERGLADVLTTQRQASRVITAQIRNHDPLRDRQVDELLRDVIAGLGRWVPASRRGQGVDPLRRLPRAGVGRIRSTLADLAPPPGPPALEAWEPDETPADLAAAAIWGGPNYPVLDELLAAARRGETTLFERDGADGLDPDVPIPLERLFAAAPAAGRRPVDLVGLLELAARAGIVDLNDVAYVDTIRPDGTRRRLAFAGAALEPVKEESP